MRKVKLVSMLLALVLIVSLLAGCTSNKSTSKNTDTSEEATSEESKKTTGEEGEEATSEESKEVVSTEGNPNGTHLDMWLFVELHGQFYAEMLKKWNEEHPDKQLQITFTTYPYTDMHDKLTLAIQSGQGAPDLCDIEITQFPNFLVGKVPFLPMNEYVAPYKDDIVQARLDIYSKDGIYYGIPTHVGATVMYYNTKILEKYGIDYTKIKTWDDFTEAGKKLYEASNGEVYMTSVDTGGTDWLWVAMAQHNEDWTDENGAPNVQLESISKMLKMQQEWLKSNVAMISPGGQVDTEEGYANISDGKIASFPKALWFMSRFLNYIPEMKDTWAIAPCPVFKEGQPRSVGIGGTGTVVLNLPDNKNAKLAAEFISWAKLSYEGNVKIWDILGFDPCNMKIWSDPEIAQNKNNSYIDYFVTNPFDTLNEIKDEIKKIKPTRISPTIAEVFNTTVLNNILENGADVDEELKAAQEQIEAEYETE